MPRDVGAARAESEAVPELRKKAMMPPAEALLKAGFVLGLAGAGLVLFGLLLAVFSVLVSLWTAR